MGDCFVFVAVGCLVRSSVANRNGGIVLLIYKGLEKTCVTLQMLLQNSAQGRGLAAPKRGSTSTPEGPPVCMRQRPEAGGWREET